MLAVCYFVDIDPQASIVIEGRVDKANVFVLEQYMQNDFSE